LRIARHGPALLTALLLAAPAGADTAVLADGRRLEGTLLGRMRGKLYFRLEGTDLVRALSPMDVARIAAAAGEDANAARPTTRPADAAPEGAADGRLWCPEAMADAVRAACGAGELPQPPPDPRRDRGWSRLTALQQEERLAAYGKARRAYEDALADCAAAKAQCHRHLDLRGREVSWLVAVRQIERSGSGEGFRVTGTAGRACRVEATVPASQKALLLRFRRREPVRLSGRVKAYAFGRAAAVGPPILGGAPETFSIVLDAGEANAPTPRERRAFYQAQVLPGPHHFVYLIDRSGSMAASFEGVLPGAAGVD
jgi:hypothetical protein